MNFFRPSDRIMVSIKSQTACLKAIRFIFLALYNFTHNNKLVNFKIIVRCSQ
jgi:hypothetical protein